MNPFDLKDALLARHAQHVVLIHFPIALFISSVAFDAIALGNKSRALAAAAYYNLLAAAVSALPAVATGLLAWQLQLDGARHYGWVELAINPVTLTGTLIKGAYESDPNTAIITPQAVPEQAWKMLVCPARIRLFR